MIMALSDDQRIVGQILAGNIPGFAAAGTPAADAKSLPLADGMEHQTGVFAEQFAVG